MPAKKVQIRKMKEILRLYYQSNLSMHQIARSLNISSGVVHKYIHKAQELNIRWPIPDKVSDKELLGILIPCSGGSITAKAIDYQLIHKECKRKGVTLQLLWKEYYAANIITLSYSQFCRYYRAWKKTQPSSMRQTHKAGEKTFIDYSGMTFNIIDPETGEIRPAEIFIGVLGASNYTYAEATWSQKLYDWIASHVRMFEYFGGVSALLVPDNLKSAVSKACRYDPDINPTYTELVTHYNTAVLPARPYRPKDKAKAEGAVLLVQRWILARLRNETFVGLAELNQAIKNLLVDLNNRPFKKMAGCRAELFKQLDKPQLQPLPKLKYEYKTYKQATVQADYHIELEAHYYSVPFRYVNKRIDIWYNQNIVECFYQGKQLAVHIRSSLKGQQTSLVEHMPKSHQAQAQWSKRRFLSWASSIGAYAYKIAEAIIEEASHEELGLRACLGVLRLDKKYGNNRLELACQYAWLNNLKTSKSVRAILQKGLDSQSKLKASATTKTVSHENIRGHEYYY